MMMGGTFEIRNKLEVLAGNKILVPGCEPTSAFTSPTLAENRDCKASVVDLADALAAIPGSTVIYMSNPRKKFFVLPDGPPPSPERCSRPSAVQCNRIDYYALLRDIGAEVDVQNLLCPQINNKPRSVSEICSAFPLKGLFG